MRFLSCFSGIEAASVAWTPLGWTCVGVAEVEPFPCAVLAHRYPDVPNLGDVTADDFLQRVSALRPDVLVGGPPCQDFSVAGLRAGLGGDRGNLSLRWVEIIRAIRPAFAVTENVPGWLSVNRGHAFGAFLAGLVGHDTALVPPRNCGGRWTNAGMVAGPLGRVAWRVMDAQYFGLAQRRKRVFAVFCPGRGADPAAVLFEPACLQGHSPPRREAGEGAPGGSKQRAAISSGRGWWDDSDVGATIRAQDSVTKADTLVSHALRADGFDASEDGTGRGTPLVACGVTIHGTDKTARVASMTDLAGALRARAPGGQENSSTTAVLAFDARQSDVIQYGDRSGPLDTDGHTVAVAFHENQRAEVTTSDTAGSLKMGGGKPGQGYPAMMQGAAVRRLTPEECEALQGFPRLYTRIPYGKKGPGSGWSADGPRYRALGNSFAVPVVRWIGERIAAQEAEMRATLEVAA